MKIYFNEVTSGYLTETEFDTMVEGLVNGVEDKKPTPDDEVNVKLWADARKFLSTFIHEIFNTLKDSDAFVSYNEGYSYRDQFIKERYGEEK
jgi:hypothetical protein